MKSVADSPAEEEITIRPRPSAYPVLAIDAETWRRYDEALLNDRPLVESLRTSKLIIPIVGPGIRAVRLAEAGEFTRVRIVEGELQGKMFVVRTADAVFELRK